MSVDRPGFADPVLDAQACFRAVLDAMARPGTLHEAGAGLTPPDGLDRATAAVLLTLIDAETFLHASAPFASAHDWIAFHCGVAATAPESSAAFVLTDRLPALDQLAGGSDEAPETSATIILQVRGFASGSRLRLSGPGLRVPMLLAVDGLPDDFIARWRVNRRQFPRGVDLLLCAGGQITALPRTVSVEEA